MRMPTMYFRSIIFALLLCPAMAMGAAREAEPMTLTIHCWDGYSRPYVDGFTALIKKKYNIDLTLQITNVSDPDEFWQLARAERVDLISPAHNIPKSTKWPFIKYEVALPIDLNNVPNYQYVIPFLQKNPFVTEKGVVYGVPYTMGPYGLAYNADKVKEPTSWKILWQPEAKGKYTISRDYPDANIFTSALMLGARYVDLYDSTRLFNQLGEAPLQSALYQLADNAYSLWTGTANPDEFDTLHYAATWGYAVAVANKNGLNWKMARPKEGTTMWVDHWVITYALAKQPLKKKIAEEWINYGLGVELQTGVIRNWGVSPVVVNLGDNITESERQTFATGDDSYWSSLSLWENMNRKTTDINARSWKKATRHLKDRKSRYIKTDILNVLE